MIFYETVPIYFKKSNKDMVVLGPEALGPDFGSTQVTFGRPGRDPPCSPDQSTMCREEATPGSLVS